MHLDAVIEEMFHGYQNIYYPNGTYQYSNVGRVNIEFEAKLLKDLNSYMQGGAPVDVPYGNPMNEAYTNWLNKLTANFTKYPTSFDQYDLDKYFGFIEAFKQSYPEYASPTNQTLRPDALLNALNGSTCLK